MERQEKALKERINNRSNLLDKCINVVIRKEIKNDAIKTLVEQLFNERFNKVTGMEISIKINSYITNFYNIYYCIGRLALLRSFNIYSYDTSCDIHKNLLVLSDTTKRIRFPSINPYLCEKLDYMYGPRSDKWQVIEKITRDETHAPIASKRTQQRILMRVKGQ